MATTKKTTTTKSTTTKKAPAKRTTKPKLEIVKDEPVQEMSVFEKMAARFPVTKQEVDLGDGLKVNVRNRLTFQEMMELVQKICDTCVDEQRGEVHMQMLDYVGRLFITAVYCGIEVPGDLDAGYAAMLGKDGLYNRIAVYIEPEQLDGIWQACRFKLRAKEDMFCSAAAKISINMMQKITELYEMISGITDDFDTEEALDVLKKLNTLTGE